MYMQKFAKDETRNETNVLINTSLGRRKKMIKYDKSSICFICCKLMLLNLPYYYMDVVSTKFYYHRVFCGT